MKISLKNWFASGRPYIWLNAGAVTVSVTMVIGLILLIAVRGLGHFWPVHAMFDVAEQGDEPISIMGEFVDDETVSLVSVGSTTNKR